MMVNIICLFDPYKSVLFCFTMPCVDIYKLESSFDNNKTMHAMHSLCGGAIYKLQYMTLSMV